MPNTAPTHSFWVFDSSYFYATFCFFFLTSHFLIANTRTNEIMKQKMKKKKREKEELPFRDESRKMP